MPTYEEILRAVREYQYMRVNEDEPTYDPDDPEEVAKFVQDVLDLVQHK